MKLKEYYVAQSISEVVTLLNKSKKNIILGGTHWLKMGDAQYNTGIDISALGLKTITETETSIEIGGDVTLRQVEMEPCIKRHAGILSHALGAIVGVQFRNTARIGASVYSKFAFSDLTAALMTLDAYVELDGSETIPLEVYMSMPKTRHFLTKVIIAKEKLGYSYHVMRENKTSLPYMILGMTRNDQKEWRISVGARPAKAILAHETMAYLNQGGEDLTHASHLLLGEVELKDNVFASQSYREHLCKVFLKRGVSELWS